MPHRPRRASRRATGKGRRRQTSHLGVVIDWTTTILTHTIDSYGTQEPVASAPETRAEERGGRRVTPTDTSRAPLPPCISQTDIRRWLVFGVGPACFFASAVQLTSQPPRACRHHNESQDKGEARPSVPSKTAQPATRIYPHVPPVPIV